MTGRCGKEMQKDICLRVAYFKNMINVSKRLNAEFYIVGGSVRDLIIRNTPGDIDIVPFGTDYRVFADFLSKEINAINIHFKDNVRLVKNNYIIDVSKPRGRKLEEDLLMRDFTINNLAISSKGEIIGDISDLNNKIIRAVYKNAFDDDPLRILRAYRFISTLGFELDSATEIQAAAKKKLLNTVAKERILAELKKVFLGEHFEKGLKAICKSGILNYRDEVLEFDYESAIRVRKNSSDDIGNDVFPIMLSVFAAGSGGNRFIDSLGLSAKDRRLIDYLVKSADEILLLNTSDFELIRRAAWKFSEKLNRIILYINSKYPERKYITQSLTEAVKTISFNNAEGVDGEFLKSLGIMPSSEFKLILDDAKRVLALSIVDKRDLEEYIKTKYRDRVK